MNYLKSFKLFEEYTDDKTVDIELIKDIYRIDWYLYRKRNRD